MIGEPLTATGFGELKIFAGSAHPDLPKEIAAVVATPLQGQGGALVRDPVAGLQAAYDQLSRSAAAFGAAGMVLHRSAFGGRPSLQGQGG